MIHKYNVNLCKMTKRQTKFKKLIVKFKKLMFKHNAMYSHNLKL